VTLPENSVNSKTPTPSSKTQQVTCALAIQTDELFGRSSLLPLPPPEDIEKFANSKYNGVMEAQSPLRLRDAQNDELPFNMASLSVHPPDEPKETVDSEDDASMQEQSPSFRNASQAAGDCSNKLRGNILNKQPINTPPSTSTDSDNLITFPHPLHDSGNSSQRFPFSPYQETSSSQPLTSSPCIRIPSNHIDCSSVTTCADRHRSPSDQAREYARPAGKLANIVSPLHNNLRLRDAKNAPSHGPLPEEPLMLFSDVNILDHVSVILESRHPAQTAVFVQQLNKLMYAHGWHQFKPEDDIQGSAPDNFVGRLNRIDQVLFPTPQMAPKVQEFAGEEEVQKDL